MKNAITCAPKVFAYLLGEPLEISYFDSMEIARGTSVQYSSALSRTYYHDHIQHWRQQPGALNFLRSKGSETYNEVMNPSPTPTRADTDTNEEARQRRGLAQHVNVGVKTCDWCGGINKPSLCTQCGEKRFCGKACQTSAWPQHKAECKRIAAQKRASSCE